MYLLFCLINQKFMNAISCNKIHTRVVVQVLMAINYAL